MCKQNKKNTLLQAFKLLFITLLISNSSIATTFADFNDVPTNHTAYQAIRELELKKIVKGFPGNNFKPDNLITRGEFLKIIFNDTGFYPAANSKNKKIFQDVNTKNWLAPYVQKAVELNLIQTNTKKFGTNNAITKIDAVKMAFQLKGIATPYSNDLNPEDLYEDVAPDHNYAYIIQVAKKLGINSNESNKFEPLKQITRAEAAEIIYQINNNKPNTINGTTVELEIGNNILNNQKFQIFLDVLKKIDENFYYRSQIDQQKMLYAAIEGAVNNLDDKYTVFQEPAEASQLNQFLQGEFEGIGAGLEIVNDQPVIKNIVIDSPAAKSGLMIGDTILTVDGASVTKLKIESVLKLIRGPAATIVKITINRNGQNLEFNVTRDKILIESIGSKIINNNIGYIVIYEFGNNTAKEFTQAIENLKSKNPRGYIIDLRNNPGGYLDSAVELLENFIAKDQVLVSTLSAKNEKTDYLSKGSINLLNLPVAVLINKNTASAAEIMAGAMQDYNIGKLIGTTSFGKGSVQQIYTYLDNSLLKISVAHWLTPKGKDINGIGLIPDIIVENSKTDSTNQIDSQLDQAINYLNSKN